MAQKALSPPLPRLENGSPRGRIDGMLIPRFTIRRLLLITALCGAFFLVVSLAIRGRVWAAAISVAVLAAAVSFCSFAVFFAAAWLVSRAGGLAARRREPASPFAQHSPPPRVVPEEIE
jgi:hypothetical protein